MVGARTVPPILHRAVFLWMPRYGKVSWKWILLSLVLLDRPLIELTWVRLLGYIFLNSLKKNVLLGLVIITVLMTVL